MTSIPDARIHFLVESAGLDGGMRGWTVDARAIADGRESLAHQEVAEREMDTFGTTLRRLRLMAGLTQEELAERAQLSERALRRLESNGTTARLQSVRLLAEALELSTDERAGLLLAARTTSSDRGVAGRRYGPARFLTPLIGREEDLAILKLLLDERRLVTVRGTGGVGKTRLAEAVAEQLTQAFDRVGFVDLAPLREPAGVLGAIAGTLSIRQQGSTPLIDVVVAALGSGRTLLVLDNLEHLLPARDTVLELLGACPGLSILATSREALRVRGERVYTLGPLRLPAREEDVFRSPAIRLFLERARDAGATLKLDEVTTKAAVEICRRLDGLPLAIELVAVRTAVLSPPVLLDRLSARLLTLEHQARDVPARQRTIHSTIAWSFDLLTPAEKALFRRLAVFSDGWTVDAADAVCQGGGGLELATLEGLTSLAEKSLLTVQDTPEERQEPRFGMVETVREFALEHLMASSETEDAYRNHALYFLRLATEAEWALSGPEQALWLERLEREHDNLRVVLRRAQQTDDVALGLALAGRLWPFWLARTHFEEAQVWLDTFLPRADAAGVTSAIRARAGYAFAALVGLRGDNERGISLLRHALHLARQAGEDAAAAETLRLLGVTEQALGHYSRAEELFGEGLGVYQRLGNQAGTCAVLSALAGVARYQGDFIRAASLYQEALDLGRAAGDSRRVADTLARLGSLETERGRPAASLPYFEEARALHHELGDTFGIADILLRSGESAADEGDYAGAMIRYEKALELFSGLGSSYAVNFLLLYQAEAALGLGDPDRAEALAARCLEFFRSIRDSRSTADALFQLAEVARARECAGEALTGYRESLARYRELNTRPEIARCLERIALVVASHGQREGAAILHGAATALRAAMGAEMAPADRPGYDRCLAMLRDQLGTEVFTAREAEGLTMSLEQVTGFALEEARATRNLA